MNFTREPIVETIITPREGCKLVIRSSKADGGGDYFVDAVEVVSFGHSFFFRSLERPKSFLVPVSDYEVLELKEARMTLKNVSVDKSIKIGGGKIKEDATLADSRPAPEREPRKRAKSRRTRRSRERVQDKEKKVDQEVIMEDHEKLKSQEVETTYTDEQKGGSSHPKELMEPKEGVEEAPSFISKLFPPPQTLIKETLSKYRPLEEEKSEDPSKELSEKKLEIEDTILELPEDEASKEGESED